MGPSQNISIHTTACVQSGIHGDSVPYTIRGFSEDDRLPCVWVPNLLGFCSKSDPSASRWASNRTLARHFPSNQLIARASLLCFMFVGVMCTESGRDQSQWVRLSTLGASATRQPGKKQQRTAHVVYRKWSQIVGLLGAV